MYARTTSKYVSLAPFVLQRTLKPNLEQRVEKGRIQCALPHSLFLRETRLSLAVASDEIHRIDCGW